jgi:hypothetical protein
MSEAAARSSQVDARMHKIAELLRAAEHRQQQEHERAQRETAQRRAEHAAQQRDACEDAARAAAAASADYTAARAAVHKLRAAGPLPALLRAWDARTEAALRFRRTLPAKEAERVRAADALGANAIPARRALYAVPGGDPAALPPAQDEQSTAG